MDIDTERLKKLWNGRTEYVEDGTRTYRVLTPNGKENPIFVPLNDSDLYGMTSGGFAKAPEPKPLGVKPSTKPPKPTPKQHITKNTDVGE